MPHDHLTEEVSLSQGAQNLKRATALLAENRLGRGGNEEAPRSVDVFIRVAVHGVGHLDMSES
jgi:hypothetical protein